MGKMHPAVVFVLQVGAVSAALVSFGALVERWWSPLKRWLQDALTYPVLKKMDEIDTSLLPTAGVLIPPADDPNAYDDAGPKVAGEVPAWAGVDAPPPPR